MAAHCFYAALAVVPLDAKRARDKVEGFGSEAAFGRPLLGKHEYISSLIGLIVGEGHGWRLVAEGRERTGPLCASFSRRSYEKARSVG